MFNCTTLTPEQLILESHNASAVPALIYLYIFTVLIFLLVGLFSIDGSKGNKPYSKFLFIWFISSVVIGAVTLYFCLSPYMLNSITEFFLSRFS
jgi:uncharacterized membrane protein